MNKLFFLLCLSAALAQAENAQTPNETLFFQNGDVMKGTLQSFDATGVEWSRSDMQQPVRFASSNIMRLDLAEHEVANRSGTNVCRIRLSNQDLLEGTIRSCDDVFLIFDTWYAGSLKIPRKNVQTILPVPPPQSAVFEGPSGIEGWTQGKSQAAADSGKWSFRNGAFYASKSASIARDLKLPDLADIQFDLRWQGTLHEAIALYSDTLLPVSLAAKENEPDFGGFYSFQINSSFVDLYAITKRDPNRALGAIAVTALAQTNAAHIELRVNKPRRSVVLLLNGVFLKEWVDPIAFVGQGTAMRFVHQGLGSIKLSNLRITKWDGIQNEKAAVTNSVSVVHLDQVVFENGRMVQGRLHSITNGAVIFATATSNAVVKLANVRQIDFSPSTLEKTAFVAGEVRALFIRGGRITLQIDQWKNEEVTGSNAILGRIKCDPRAFSSVQFGNP